MNSFARMYDNIVFKKELTFFSHKYDFKLNVSLVLKVLAMGLGLAAFFVGALMFQVLAVGKGSLAQAQSADLASALSIPGAVLGLVFGTLTIVSFIFRKQLAAKLGEDRSWVAPLLLTVFAAVCVAAIAIGASAYVAS